MLTSYNRLSSNINVETPLVEFQSSGAGLVALLSYSVSEGEIEPWMGSIAKMTWDT